MKISTNYFVNLSIVFLFVLLLSNSCKKTDEIAVVNLKYSISDSLFLYKTIDSLNNNYNKSNEKLIEISDKIISIFPNKIAKTTIKIAHIHFNHENFYLAKYYFSKAAKKAQLLQKLH